jgi:hypothetical protein
VTEISTARPDQTDESPLPAGDTLELPGRAIVVLRRS